jgi:hypothetical protein
MRTSQGRTSSDPGRSKRPGRVLPLEGEARAFAGGSQGNSTGRRGGLVKEDGGRGASKGRIAKTPRGTLQGKQAKRNHEHEFGEHGKGIGCFWLEAQAVG